MRLVTGADVYSSAGEKLGSLSRVILDPHTREVTHLVIEKGLLFTTKKLIPMSRVNPENEEMITLLSSEQKPEGFQDFEESHYVNIDSTEIPTAEVESSYWYPPTNHAWWRSGMQTAYPAMPIYTRKTTQNIPVGTVALEEGASVLSSDGKQAGNIEQLIVDPEDHRVTHLVISAGLLFKERKLVPVPLISTIREQEVRRSVNSGTLERLPAYQNIH